MLKLRDIAVRVEAIGGVGSPANHSNAIPVLHEVLHSLKRLKERGVATTIDLKSIPFGPGDEEALIRFLGCGEVSIELQSLGKSRICETLFPGVWLVDHHNAAGAGSIFTRDQSRAGDHQVTIRGYLGCNR